MTQRFEPMNRRELLQASVAGAALAATTVGAPMLGPSPAAAASPFTRNRIGSQAGDQHVLAYRNAVRLMRERSEKDHTDPLGWTFQGMIHGILTRQPKQAAIDQFFDGRPATDPVRMLATAVWETCPHTTRIDDIRLDFLPWHRIFLYYFEKVVRAASGDSTFALPFWEYSRADRRMIPAAFREAVNGALWRNALYIPRRDPVLNDPTQPGSLNLSNAWQDALDEERFEPEVGPTGQLVKLGFSLALEIDPHGPIHTLTSGADERGNPNGDMGDPATAGRDPIFWVHHAAIDWFWARWLTARGLNNDWIKQQPWANQRWSFADEQGRLVEWTFADFVTRVSDNPGYDSLDDSAPAGSMAAAIQAQGATPATGAAAAPAQAAVEATSTRGITLSGRPTTTTLSAAPATATAAAAAPASARQTLALRLSGVRTDRPLGVVYNVYLNLDDPARPEESRRVGAISFFGMDGHAGHSAAAGPSPGRTFIFQLRGAARDVAARQPSDLRLTFVPSAQFGGSPVRVESIELIRSWR